MAVSLRFGLLGPLAVLDGTRECSPTAPRLRTLLALLLVRANTAVSHHELVEELWGTDPPAGATNTLQVFVRRLRRLLTPDYDARHPEQVLCTSAAGYSLRVAPEQVDLARFEKSVTSGRRAASAGDDDAAAALLREGLGLWRGPALADVPAGRLLEAQAVALEEARLAALEERIDADLRLARHRDVVAELHTLTAEHPLREGFWRRLMLALYRCGRRAEALDAYQRLRTSLVADLGLEPSCEIRLVHQAILAGDTALDDSHVTRRPPPSGPATAPGPPPLAQLPAAVPDFTGRHPQLATLRSALLDDAPANDGVAPAAVISGKAGVGKTTLAVHTGHRLAHAFPDGQLYVELRGGSGSPVDPADVLVRVLRVLGCDGAGIPDALEERSQLYRSRLVGRRVLLVLDDAADESQVRPLLPASSGSAVLVTSRRRLSGLEGAVGVDLPLFTSQDAVELLGRLAGGRRISADPGSAERITGLCGLLPLAVRVAGAKLAARPHWSLADLERRLTSERHRLAELSVGDLDVRASLALSYQACASAAQLAFRLLSCAPAADFPAWVAAAACDRDLAEAESVVENLVDMQLLQVAGRDELGFLRYQFHDLLRVFAAERLAAQDGDAARREALVRIVTAYAELARYADEALRPGRLAPALPRRREPRWEPHPELVRTVRAEPVRWFAAERGALVASVRTAHAAGLWHLTGCAAAATVGFFDLRSYWDDWLRVGELAVDAADRSGDRYAAALARYDLALLHVDRGLPGDERLEECLAAFEGLGRHRESGHVLADMAIGRLDERRITEALELGHRGLALAEETGDARGEALASRAVANSLQYGGRPAEALTSFDRSLAGFRSLGDRRWEAYVLLGRAGTREVLGELDQAAEDLSTALRILRDLDDRRWEAYALRTLGHVRRRQGRRAEAASCYRRGLAILRRLGDRRSEAYVARSLGDLYRVQGRLAEARTLLDDALAIFTEFGDSRGRPTALTSLAGVARAEGRLSDAVRLATQALTLQRELSVPLGEATALIELGESFAGMGDADAAVCRWQEALRILRRVGASEADRVLALIEGVGGSPDADAAQQTLSTP